MPITDKQRPQPRPRPKPKLQTAPSSEDATSLNSSPTIVPKTAIIEIVDDDEMFMRNRNRTAKVWTALEKRVKAKEALYEDSEDEELLKTPLRGKSKRKKESSPWQGKKVIERLQSVDNLDDDDDDIQVNGVSSAPRAPQIPKQKRQRTRSRSITPPPEIPQYEVQYARRLVNHKLNVPQRTASPNFDDANDDDADMLFSNPELAQLAQSVAAERARSRASSKPDINEPAEIVHIAVKWQPHPLNPDGKEEFFFFKMNRDDNFQDLFEATAEDASILTNNLIVSYNNKRIYASVTPKALQIRGEAELVACDKVTYEHIRSHPVKTTDPVSLNSDESSEPGVSSGGEAPPTLLHEEDASDSDVEGDTFKLTLRSATVGKDITLTVRPTTKCGSIVKAYLTKAGVADQYPEIFATVEGSPSNQKKSVKPGKDPRLSIDGERMENGAEIRDADLEDGDLVEVVGL